MEYGSSKISEAASRRSADCVELSKRATWCKMFFLNVAGLNLVNVFNARVFSFKHNYVLSPF